LSQFFGFRNLSSESTDDLEIKKTRGSLLLPLSSQ
jgi:hypothetical protein